MEILNTIQGAALTEMTNWFWINVFLFVFGFALMAASVQAESFGGFLVGLAMWVAGFIIVIIINASPSVDIERPTGEYAPNQYEVKLTDPNYVIDATKYRYIGKRGEITILEEVQK